MTDLDTILITAHRGNIERYRRLLQTKLTELEREFLERRLAEERSALQQLFARNPSLIRERLRQAWPERRAGTTVNEPI